MNAIGFIFSILSILSLGAFLSLENQIGSARLRSNYTGRFNANREILNQAESKLYKSFKKAPSADPQTSPKKKKSKDQVKSSPAINPECARLNLHPLLEGSPKEHRILYETAAKILKTWYGKTLLENKAGAEYRFLNSFLRALSKNFNSLEKVHFETKELQKIYYQMLKGSKENNLPSLMDLVRVEPAPATVCIHHAHPHMLSALFTPKAASHLYNQIHEADAPAITRELIERICLDSQHIVNADIFDLLYLGKASHPEKTKTTFVVKDEDSQVCIRKTIRSSLSTASPH